MVGQRLGPSLALVQKRGRLELAQSCCTVHLARVAGQALAPRLPPPRPSPCPEPHRVSRAHQPQ